MADSDKLCRSVDRIVSGITGFLPPVDEAKDREMRAYFATLASNGKRRKLVPKTPTDQSVDASSASDYLSLALANSERLAALLQQWLCDPQSLDADEVELTLLDCGYEQGPLCGTCRNQTCPVESRTARECKEYQ